MQNIVNLQHQARKFTEAKDFFSYLKAKIAEQEFIMPRVEKILSQLQANEEDIDEVIFSRIGAKLINSLLSGQFQGEDINIPQLQASLDSKDREKRQLTRILSLFASKLSIIDEKINTMLILRNDIPSGSLYFSQLYYQHKLDKHQLLSQF